MPPFPGRRFAVALSSTALLLALSGCATPSTVELPSASAVRSSTPEERNAPQIRIEDGGHYGFVHAVVASPDGRRLYSGGDDKNVRIWDLAEGKLLDTLRMPSGPGIEGRVLGLSVSPDGRWLAVSGCFGCTGFWGEEDANLIHLIDLSERRIASSGGGHRHLTRIVRFSPDGRLLLTGSADRSLRIWKVGEDGALFEEDVLTGHGGEILDVAWFPDGDRFVVVAADGLISSWARHPFGGWHVEKAVVASTGVPNAVDIGDGGTRIVTGDSLGMVKVWDGDSLSELRTIRQFSGIGVRDVTISPDGKRVAFGTSLNDTEVEGFGTLSIMGGEQDIVRTNYAVIEVGWIPGDVPELIVTKGHLGRIGIWRSAPLKQRLTLQGSGMNKAFLKSLARNRIAWAPTDEDDSPYYVLDLTNVKSEGRWDAESEPAIERAIKGRSARYGGNIAPGVLWVWRQFEGDGYVDTGLSDIDTALFLSKDWISVTNGSYVRILETSGRSYRDCFGLNAELTYVLRHGNGAFLITASADRILRVWDVESCACLLSFFHDRSGGWVVWNHEGYYKGSRNGRRRVGLHTNRGPRALAEFRPITEFPERHRPDLVERTMARETIMAIRADLVTEDEP